MMSQKGGGGLVAKMIINVSELTTSPGKINLLGPNGETTQWWNSLILHTLIRKNKKVSDSYPHINNCRKNNTHLI